MEPYIYFIIAGALLAAIILIAGSIYLKKRKAKKLGIEGEKKVAGILKKYAGIRSFKVINDLYLPLYDKTTQIDHILVGFFGILVIETKNYSGEVYGDPKKKDWVHIVGGKRYPFYNPLMQNQTHMDCIRYVLGKENLYNMNMESLVVFTNPKSQLYIPSKTPVIKVSQLTKFLKQARFQKDNNFDVDKIVAALHKHQVTDRNVEAKHIKNVKKMAKKR